MTLIVNGERIEQAEMDSAWQQLAQQQAANTLQPGGAEEWGEDPEAYVRNAVIARTLVKQEAVKRNAPVPRERIEAELEAAKEQCGGEEAFRESMERAQISLEDVERDIVLRLQVDLLLDEACRNLADPTEEDIRAYYEANREQFVDPERIRAAHVVKHVQGTVIEFHEAHEEMQSMLERIRAGTPFEEIASQHSDCPENAGDLGYFPRGAMVPEFEEVAFNLEINQVSEVFQTPFGLHIVKLYDRIPETERGFEAVKDNVREALFRDRENAAIDAYTDTLKAQAVIENVEDGEE